MGEIKTIAPFLEHPDSRVRANAIEALEFIGSVKIYPFILTRLKDSDNRVRANASRCCR